MSLRLNVVGGGYYIVRPYQFAEAELDDGPTNKRRSTDPGDTAIRIGISVGGKGAREGVKGFELVFNSSH